MMLAGRRLVSTIILVFAVSVSPVLWQAASGQGLPGVPQSLLDQLQRPQPGGETGEQTVPQTAPAPIVQRTRATPPPGSPPTALESDYSQRSNTTLRLFGRDVFAQSVVANGAVTGAIRDSYVLGFGDEIIVNLRGQMSRTLRTRVGRDGQVILPDLAPVAAVGRSFGEFRAELDALIKRSFLNTEDFVSLGDVRQITVLLTGEVNAPGQKRLSAFATIIDALSGELSPVASLRNITITRDGKARTIDFYSLLLGSKPALDLNLIEGDQISVAPLGATVAITGDITRPAIYEVPRSGITPDALVTLAGGFLRPAGNRLMRISFDASGKQRTSEIEDHGRITLAPGDILIVGRRENIQIGQVSLYGRVRVPGERALVQTPTVRALIGDASMLGVDPYLPLGILVTVDPATQIRQMQAFDLGAVLAGTQDYRLRSLDSVIVLGRDDVAFLGSADVQSVLIGQAPPSVAAGRPLGQGEAGVVQRTNGAASGPTLVTSASRAANDANVDRAPTPLGGNAVGEQGCPALQALASVMQADNSGRFSNAVQVTTVGGSGMQNVQPCPAIMGRFPDVLPFLIEHALTVRGEVRRPGTYPIGDASLAEVVQAAGGVTHAADLKNIEISHFTIDGPDGSANVSRQTVSLSLADFARVPLFTGDVVHFNSVYDQRDRGPVVLIGEFKQPGPFDIRRGERLSEVIRRAGGLTDSAYPYGAVLTRASARQSEQDGINRSIRQIEAGLTSAVVNASSANTSTTTSVVASLQSAMAELRSAQPVGRVVFEADPATLASRPDLDIILEPGDRIVMPKRPIAVAVTGDVLNPSSQQFEAGLSAKDYINRAGGFLRSADEDHVFVVLPNGSAAPVSSSLWSFSKTTIPPGSTVVVPRDLSPDTLSIIRDVTQIMSQIAITAASLAVINN